MTDRAAEGPGLFDGVLARGPVREAVGDRAWFAAMFEVEGALARAEARAGVISASDADAIVAACRPESFDIAAIGRAAAETGTPVVPLVAALRTAVGGKAAANVHRGATSQDIVDTATMLVARRSIDLILDDLHGAAEAAARLAVEHRATPIAGRTLLQHAQPTTFGAKVAGWLVGLDAAADRLAEIRASRLAVELGGAVGTLDALGTKAPLVLGLLAEELDLAEPVSPWHTERTRITELAGALGTTAGALAKPALDVILLAQTEIGEVREGVVGRGGSSTMPHKRNPIAAISARASAIRTPGLVATILVASVGEHERAAGGWHAEWLPLRDLLTAVGSAAAWLRDCLEHLEVDTARMRENLVRSAGLDIVAGSAEAFVDRALAAHVTRSQAGSGAGR